MSPKTSAALAAVAVTAGVGSYLLFGTGPDAPAPTPDPAPAISSSEKLLDDPLFTRRHPADPNLIARYALPYGVAHYPLTPEQRKALSQGPGFVKEHPARLETTTRSYWVGKRVHGLRDGEWRLYDDKNRLQAIQHWKKGDKVGHWVSWSKMYQKVLVIAHDGGSPISFVVVPYYGLLEEYGP